MKRGSDPNKDWDNAMNKNPDDRDPSHINALVEQRAERARKEAAERAKQAKAKQKKR